MSLRVRNRGVVPSAVARAIASKTVAIAGAGGVGGNIAVPFVRQCRVARIKVADLDYYDTVNRNCQVGAFESTQGQSKVEVVARLLRDIDPTLAVEEFPEGVTLANLDDFLDGVDLVVNAVDFKHPEIHLALTRRARQLGIPVVMGIEIAYGARAVWFDPHGMPMEDFFGLTEESSQIPLEHMIMWAPPYLDIKALEAVNRGEIPAPSIATGGMSVAALLVPMIEAILSGIDVPPPAPRARYVDTKAGKAGTIRFHRLVWTLTGLRLKWRNSRGLNQSAL